MSDRGPRLARSGCRSGQKGRVGLNARDEVARLRAFHLIAEAANLSAHPDKLDFTQDVIALTRELSTSYQCRALTIPEEDEKDRI